MTDWTAFHDTVSDIRFALLVTHDADHLMQARPLTTQAASHDGAVWFFTVTDSEAVDDIRQNPTVLLCYADSVKNRFISSSGTASLSQDRHLMEMLWNPAFVTFFPLALADPSLALLRVDINKADIWETGSSKVEQMLAMAKTSMGTNIDTAVDKTDVDKHRALAS